MAEVSSQMQTGNLILSDAQERALCLLSAMVDVRLSQIVLSLRQSPRTVDALDRWLRQCRVEHFSAKELTTTPSGETSLPPHECWPHGALICAVMEGIRTSPIRPRWWYRDERLNRSVRGAADSDHLRAEAMDLYFSGSKARDDAYAYLLSLQRHFPVSIGYGGASHMLHVGILPTNGAREWRY